MVVEGHPRSRKGGAGGIVEHPAIETVAVGLVVGGGGVEDALASLASHPDDWLIRTAIVQKAQELDQARLKATVEATANLTGKKVAEMIGKMFGG